MKWSLSLPGVGMLFGCVLLSACEKPQQAPDLYAQPAKGAPVDNDSYYIAPLRTASTCIDDSPDCSGI